MRVIIAGGRNFDNYEFVKNHCDYLLANLTDVEIVSGRCDYGIKTFTTDSGIDVFGVDGLGEKYAKEKGISVKAFPANWGKFGKSAGPKEIKKWQDMLMV